ncbi:MAG TPA: sigma 54-interacting transcriptional regulator [Thermoguttaceae bacterium]|nr:sigma 54-interacting transcriptional regulator [Thermoguttaceae bacterium]
MARSRTIAGELAKLLNSAAQPIYVLDDEQTLIFCNKACLEWVGRTADQLHGRRCAYHSSPEATGPDAVAAGLCPSPEVLAGRETSGTIACVDAEGRLRRRRARFVPLGGSPEDTIGLIALVDTEDLPDPDQGQETAAPPTDQTETAWLHDRIRAFRHQAAERVRVDRLLGETPAARRARTQVVLAAQNRASVLVVGPTGSGRQHVAEAIHYAARLATPGSLIPLACSVLGADLIRSTVAALASRRPAPGEIGGTLLLNEADELPPEVQPEMARVFAARSFPMRLIATARHSLDDLARRGKYREDLASLLSTIVIELPPLAERRGDLPLLAQLFLEEANARGTKQLAGFSPEALDRLDGYAWPGNLDELAQMVTEAHRRAEGARIEVGDLPERIHLAAYAAAHPRRPEETIVLDEFLGRIERELIHRALAQAKGNKTKAAKLLGMTRPRLYRRLVQLGLEEDSPESSGEGPPEASS